MNFYLALLLSLTICIPALIGLIRIKIINEVYFPFIIYIWVGAANEIYGTFDIYSKHSNIASSNIYILIESLLLVWQFNKWRLIGSQNKISILMGIVLILFWITEIFFFFSITTYASYFTIFYSSIFTFISISSINKLIVTERKLLLKNPQFIICSAFIIYFTMVILAEIFWIYGVTQNETFALKVYSISIITNFISIILYTLAIIWMPIKHRFTLPSS